MGSLLDLTRTATTATWAATQRRIRLFFIASPPPSLESCQRQLQQQQSSQTSPPLHPDVDVDDISAFRKLPLSCLSLTTNFRLASSVSDIGRRRGERTRVYTHVCMERRWGGRRTLRCCTSYFSLSPPLPLSLDDDHHGRCDIGLRFRSAFGFSLGRPTRRRLHRRRRHRRHWHCRPSDRPTR